MAVTANITQVTDGKTFWKYSLPGLHNGNGNNVAEKELAPRTLYNDYKNMKTSNESSLYFVFDIQWTVGFLMISGGI